MRDNSATNILFLFITLIIRVVNAETCLTQAQLAAIVFGISLGTLIIALTIAFILWRFAHNKRTDENIIIVEKAAEKAAYENGALEMEHKATEPMPPQLIDKSQRSRSPESAAELKEIVRMALESRDITPLGFDIQQSRNCIFVASVKPNGPADKSGNVFVGDRIKALSVSFEGMLLEDAIGILSCAAPYRMKLELERTLTEEDEEDLRENITTIDEYLDIEISAHPPFRSISLNSLSSNSSSEKRTRGGSWMSKQKYPLPRDVKCSDSISPESTTHADSLSDSYRDASSPTVSTVTASPSTTMPISVIIEKISPNSEIESPLIGEILPPALPTSPPPNVSPDSSPKTPIILPSMIEKSSSPKARIAASTTPKISRLPVPKYSPKLALKIEEIQRNGIEEFVEVSHFTFSQPTLSTKRIEQVEFCEHLEPKRQSIVVEFKENHPKNHNRIVENEEESLEILRLERELTPVEMPPRIVGIKVEKISETSPIIERKLPPLPKMIDIPTEDEKNGAALYIEQKDALRRTFVPRKTNENGVILGKEQKARLEANRSILDRQEKELRALGVLP
uniref:AAA+ ATPase domain-containing protein n=1 Tax=Parascaris univalens TaxID=6257 RepID=A0A915CG14_PARUN